MIKHGGRQTFYSFYNVSSLNIKYCRLVSQYKKSSTRPSRTASMACPHISGSSSGDSRTILHAGRIHLISSHASKHPTKVTSLASGTFVKIPSGLNTSGRYSGLGVIVFREEHEIKVVSHLRQQSLRQDFSVHDQQFFSRSPPFRDYAQYNPFFPSFLFKLSYFFSFTLPVAGRLH